MIEMLSTTAASVETTRMALCALSYGGNAAANPVHVVRLSNFAHRAAPIATPRVDLDEMSGLCEAVNLGRGYWLPVPPTTVEIGPWTLLLAPHPQMELQRALGIKVDILGLARVHKRKVDLGWMHRSLEDWTRIPQSTAAWTSEQLDRHRSQLMPTRNEGGAVEFYRATPKRRGEDFRRWLPLARAADISPPEALLLCRERDRARSVRHFMGLQTGGELTHETPLACNLVRLQFGLEMHSGGGQRVITERAGSVLRFRLSRPLPPEERTLLAAISRIESNERFSEICIDSEIAAAAFTSLEKLGFEMAAIQ